MKKKILPMFFLLSLAMGLCIAVSGCSALKLKAPANLRVSDDGFLSWDEVDGAAAYRVFINDGVFDTDENRLDIFWLTDSYGEYLIDVVASFLNTICRTREAGRCNTTGKAMTSRARRTAKTS